MCCRLQLSSLHVHPSHIDQRFVLSHRRSSFVLLPLHQSIDLLCVSSQSEQRGEESAWMHARAEYRLRMSRFRCIPNEEESSGFILASSVHHRWFHEDHTDQEIYRMRVQQDDVV